jgi:hypothetical protein
VYSSTPYLTSYLDESGWPTPRPGRFITGYDPTLYKRLGGSQGRSEHVQKISPPMEFDPRTLQPVVSRYTDYTISAEEVSWS